MTNVTYDLITRLAILAGVASVFLYGHSRLQNWLAIFLGAVAASTAVGTYFWNSIVKPTPPEVAPEAPAEAVEQEHCVLSTTEADLVSSAPDSIWSINDSVIIAEAKSSPKIYFDQSLWTEFRTVNYVDAFHLYTHHKQRDIAADVVRIANELSSDRYEIVLSPLGEIIVRPFSRPVAPENIDRDQRRLSFGDEPGSHRPN